jgi:hypothetical protein
MLSRIPAQAEAPLDLVIPLAYLLRDKERGPREPGKLPPSSWMRE